MPDTPSIFSVSPYSRAIAREMYPGQFGQDDQQDAARHMLAAGTMARKYGPTVADLAGKAHEYSTSPLRALMMMLGRGEMPPDYKQDMHNNALGIELARRAQSQLELEDLVQQAAERAATTRTEGRPWVNKAKGGEVSADELNRPFIGYRSAGRRPESQQDRRASADAPLAALRGMVSGVLGAPGDIESLVRMLPGLSEQTVLPTSEDVERRLPLRSVSETPGGQRFVTEDEYKDIVRKNAEGFASGGLVQKYADGGLVGSNIYNSDAMQDPASAYRFADGGQAGDVRAYADGGLVANSHTADFDPDRIDAIVGELHALNAG